MQRIEAILQRFWRPALILVLTLLPAYIVFQLILRYAVNVPFHDTWTLWLYDYVMLPQMSFSDALSTMWILQNEHRIFLPRILLLPLSYLTNLNLIVIMGASIVILLLIVALFWRAARRDVHLRRYSWLPIGISVLVFAITASDRYINENAFPIFCAVLFSAIAIYFLTGTRLTVRQILYALSATIAASLSFSSGYVTLIIGGLVLLLSKQYRQTKYVALWISISGALALLYLLEVIPKLEFIGENTLTLNPITVLLSILRLIGAPLSPVWPIPAIFGLVTVTLFALLSTLHVRDQLRDPKSRLDTFWVIIGCWALLTAALAAVGRSSVQGEGTPTRYFIYGQVFQLALMMVALQTIHRTTLGSIIERSAKPVLIGCAIAIPVGTYAFATIHFDYHSEFRVERAFLTDGYRCLRSGRIGVNDLDCVRPLFFNSLTVNLMAPYVFRRGISSVTEDGATGSLVDFVSLQDYSTSQSQFHVAEFRVDGQSQRGIPAIPAQPLRWSLELPSITHTTLSTHLMLSAPGEGGQVGTSEGFEIAVLSENGDRTLIYSHSLNGPTEDLVPVFADLSAFAGMQITLELLILPSIDSDTIAGYWVEPRFLRQDGNELSPMLTLPAELVTGEQRRIRLPEGFRTYDHADAPMFNYEEINVSTSVVHSIPASAFPEITWRFHIPPSSTLVFETGLFLPPSDVAPETNLRAEIEARAGNNVTDLLFSDEIAPSFDVQWLRFDLSRFAGVLPSSPLESVILTLRILEPSDISTSANSSERVVGAFWIEPTLIHAVPNLARAPIPENFVLIRLD